LQYEKNKPNLLRGGKAMATIMLIMIVGLLLFTFIPWIGNVKQYKLHHTDLMAGDEGED
jgi:hypothetical protein